MCPSGRDPGVSPDPTVPHMSSSGQYISQLHLSPPDSYKVTPEGLEILSRLYFDTHVENAVFEMDIQRILTCKICPRALRKLS